MKKLGTIQGCDIIEDNDGKVLFIADADIDCDGGSNPHHDPCWQPETTLRHNGHSIDAETVPFIVVPPLIIKATKGIVMGCRSRVTHALTGKRVECVVADSGPTKKIGELSVAAAKAIGVNPNPNTGGEERRIIHYELWPGTPATVNGIRYQLQPAGKA